MHSNKMLELEADRLSDQERGIWPQWLQGLRTLGQFNEGSGRGVAHAVGEERGNQGARSQGALAPLIVDAK